MYITLWAHVVGGGYADLDSLLLIGRKKSDLEQIAQWITVEAFQAFYSYFFTFTVGSPPFLLFGTLLAGTA